MKIKKFIQLEEAFTLIELMIVVAIIGILAAIAVPKFADMVRKAQEATTKGNLGALRSMIMIYYSGNGGMYPSALSSAIENTQYMSDMPLARRPPYHTDSALAAVANGIGFIEAAGTRAQPGSPNQYGWRYVFTGTDGPDEGVIFVYCSHTASNGTLWSAF